MEYKNTGHFVRGMDANDPLSYFREKFFIPERNGRRVIYFCGNSLGLQPVTVKHFVNKELETWKEKAVEGHFGGETPWIRYNTLLKPGLAKLCGASPDEVVPMNSLTSNLHFLLVSFYKPSKTRFKILTEASAFPSDAYALQSQTKFHGFNPSEAIIEVEPQPGEYYISTTRIIKAIEENKDDLALILFSGIQYISGQLFDIEAITKAAHHYNIPAGFDLAHAIGNVPLRLSNWDVDFAVWCSYKYLNSGPGNVAGIYVNKKYGKDIQIPKFWGWWGAEEKSRFLMQKEFISSDGADGWLLSNGNIISLAAQRASLEIFEEAGIEELRKKSLALTGYLEYILENLKTKYPSFEIITPKTPSERGCQLSLLFKQKGRHIFDELIKNDVIVDWREPGVIRVAPTPLYNTFGEVYHFGIILANILKEMHKNQH